MLGCTFAVVLIPGQKVFDAVISVEGIDRADMIGKLLPPLCPLAFTLCPRLFGLFCGQTALFSPTVNLLDYRAVGVEAKRFAAQDAVLVKQRLKVRPAPLSQV